MIHHPAAGAVADDILTTAVNAGDEAEHLGGGEIPARPNGVTVGARDTGERETSHFWHLQEKISVPRVGGSIIIIAYIYL